MSLDWLWPARKLGLSSALDRALAAGSHAVWHMHGLWMMSTVYPARHAAHRDLSLLLSPRGMMSNEAMRFSATRKRLFWKFLQSRALAAVDCFHATGEAEAEAIRLRGFAQPIAVIPNGIDLPQLEAPRRHFCREVVSLGRIHPKKGLDRLVAAWARLEPIHPEWRLRIVGPDEGGHAAELVALAAALRLTRVSVEPPVFGPEKWRLLQDAELFVLATLNENFAMTVAESLACATPVISTKGAPWAGLVDEDCGWWTDHGVEPLAAALGQAMALPSEALAAMGRRGRDWMERDFGWDGVSRRMMAVYAWLRGVGERPPHVLLD
jgi:glycosyltransferase involved in cell wall biosynthesis